MKRDSGSIDWRRRRLIKGAVAASLLAGVGGYWHEEIRAFAKDAELFIKGPPVPDIAPEQLSEHVWMIYAKDGFPTPENRGMMSNITFVVTDDGLSDAHARMLERAGVEVIVAQIEREP